LSAAAERLYPGGVRRALILAACLVALPAHGESLEDRRRTLQRLAAQEDALAARMGADRNALARLLGALELFSRDPPPPLLVSPADAKDAVRAMILAKAIAPELEQRARVLAAESQALTQVRRRAAQASGELFTAESQIEDRRDRLDAVASDAALMPAPQPGAKTPCPRRAKSWRPPTAASRFATAAGSTTASRRRESPTAPTRGRRCAVQPRRWSPMPAL